MQNGLTAVPEISFGSEEEISAEAAFKNPAFYETLEASLSNAYYPIISAAQEALRFGPDERDPSFVAKDNIPESMRQFASSLLTAESQAQMDFKVASIRRKLRDDRILSESSYGAQAGAMLVDPVNYSSLPLKALGAVSKPLAMGASTGLVTAGQEAIRYPFDETATAGEVALNVGAGFGLGYLLGKAVTVPSERRIAAVKKGTIELERLSNALNPEGDAAKAGGEATFDSTGKILTAADGTEVDLSIATNLFTDSIFFKAVSTPMKRTLQDPTVPNATKLTMLEIANDAGILLNANRQGFAIKNAVFQNAKLREGEWVQLNDRLTVIWGNSTAGPAPFNRMDYMPDRGSYEAWLTEVDSKAMRGEKPANDFEAKAMDELNEFYVRWEKRLNDTGLIGNRRFYEKDIVKREARIQSLEKDIRENKIIFKHGKRAIESNKRIIASHKATLAEFKQAGPISPKNEEIFRPRYWDKDAIKKNRAGLERVLYDWFRDNPEGFGYDEKGMYTKVTYSTQKEAIEKRASDAVDNILGMKDVTDVDVASFGYGKSKHMQHRAIDIPNKLVLDYIHKNPIAVMKAYTARTAARYEFAVKFDGLSIDDVLDDKMVEMLGAGMSEDKANAVLKDIRHMYDRVAGVVLREPDTLDQRIAEVMRTAAQLGYLGAAGISALTEPAKIIMEHGLGPTMKGMFGILDSSQLKLGAREARIAGEALEILMGSSHMRLVEDMGNNPLRSSYMDKAKNGFYLLNGLAPITRIFKDFDGMMRSHTLIDYSVRWSEGKATKMEREYLLRYGIDEFDAKKIAASPWQKSDSGLYMANTEAWNTDDLLRSAVEKDFVYNRPSKRFSTLSQQELNNHFRQEFPEATIYTDSEVVIPYFIRLEEQHGFKSLLGFMTDMRDIPDGGFSVHLDKDMIINRYEDIKTDPRSMDQIRSDAKQALDEGKIKEEYFHHINNELDAIDLFETADDYFEYIMLHELHHSVINRRVGETTAAVEDRIDKAAIAYMRDQRAAGKELAIQAQMNVLRNEQKETVKSFRNALSSGIANTILMGTPADKPIITDGVAYIPMRVAKQFGMKEDEKYKGYARIENGLLGLPFQFYSYALAAANKTTAALAHGQMKSELMGVLVAMGLGYTVLQIKTPDYIEMSFQDKLARSFDFSGIAALYSDLLYTSMSTALALGGPNITGGALQPRYPQDPSAIDAFTGLAGAGPSIAQDYIESMANMLTGNVGKGANQFVNSLPGQGILLWNGRVNDLGRMLEGALDDSTPTGFGRY